ncbi:MAG: dioxygenase [Desulfobulbaceae bacterium]|nr:dioxygenase [Desulfobulbaceae bacterium]
MNTIPSLFISHGPPSVAFMKNETSGFLKSAGRMFPTPTAIISVSAHWEALYAKVTSSDNPQIRYDFSGPKGFMEMSYETQGRPELAQKVTSLLNQAGIKAELDENQGFDHGTWIPLMMMYPSTKIPIIQISLQTEERGQYHFDLGRALRPLRDEGALIMGTGGAVHNLDEIRKYSLDAEPPDYVRAFDTWLEDNISQGNIEQLINYKKEAPDFDKCHPYPAEHFLPMFVALGAGSDPKGRLLHRSFLYGTLSMASYAWD